MFDTQTLETIETICRKVWNSVTLLCVLGVDCTNSTLDILSVSKACKIIRAMCIELNSVTQ